MRLTTDKLIFAALIATTAWYACPTQAQKNAGGLRLNAPVETPNSVHFSWTGGQDGTTYSLYRRMRGDANWERIAMNLSGIAGAVDVDGFTLDQTYDYEIRRTHHEGKLAHLAEYIIFCAFLLWLCWPAIRVCLEHEEELRTEKRAAEGGNR